MSTAKLADLEEQEKKKSFKEGYYMCLSKNVPHFTKGKNYYFSERGEALAATDDMLVPFLWTNKDTFKEYFLKVGYTLEEWDGTPLGSIPQVEVKQDPDKGLRHNSGKVRYDLLHPKGIEGIAKVMTKGAQKYAERNWERGMKWSKVLASMKRHVAAFEMGIDYDIDDKCEDCNRSTKDNWACSNHTGELHVDLIQTNAHFLSAYYKIYPQGDDRPHTYLNPPKIGLDIDEVLCDWVGDWMDHRGLERPESWYFDRGLMEEFEKMKKEGKLDEFYLNLKPLIKPSDLPFEPHCYITSRPVDTKITEQWLAKHSFPARPVYTTTKDLNKVMLAKDAGVEIFVDDNYDNFKALNNAGICCFLMDAPHNRRYNVGFKRITDLSEIM